MTHLCLKSPKSSVITLKHENSKAHFLVARHLLLLHPLVFHHLIVLPLTLTSHLVPLLVRVTITDRTTYNRTSTLFRFSPPHKLPAPDPLPYRDPHPYTSYHTNTSHTKTPYSTSHLCLHGASWRHLHTPKGRTAVFWCRGKRNNGSLGVYNTTLVG